MAVSIISGTGGTLLQVDPTNLAARTSLRPIEIVGSTSGGFFRSASRSTGITTVLTGAPVVWTMRWTSANLNALVYAVKVGWTVTTGFTGAQAVDFGLFVARSYTVSPTTNSTAITLTGNNQKKRTSLATSANLIWQITNSSTSGITGQTLTADSNPVLQRYAWAPAATAGNGPNDFGYLFDMSEYPVTLANNEGLTLQVLTTMGAAGVISLYVEAAWAEVPTANF